jgi:ABC-type anion transport system duplicated permease subunit
MKFHWVTDIILMAVFARLAVDIVRTAHAVIELHQFLASYPGAESYWPIVSAALVKMSQAIVYVGAAGVVETLHRILKGLQKGSALAGRPA